MSFCAKKDPVFVLSLLTLASQNQIPHLQGSAGQGSVPDGTVFCDTLRLPFCVAYINSSFAMLKKAYYNVHIVTF